MDKVWKKGEDNSTISIALPYDISPFVSWMLAEQSVLHGGMRRVPVIMPLADILGEGGKIVLQAGQNKSIVIFGTDLWRNPRVLVGTQMASTISILPDMAGLVASFDDLAMPTSESEGKPVDVDLIVVTSEGKDYLRNAVRILPNAVAK